MVFVYWVYICTVLDRVVTYFYRARKSTIRLAQKIHYSSIWGSNSKTKILWTYWTGQVVCTSSILSLHDERRTIIRACVWLYRELDICCIYFFQVSPRLEKCNALTKCLPFRALLKYIWMKREYIIEDRTIFRYNYKYSAI